MSFIFAPKNIAGHPLDYVHLFTLNHVFLQGHSKSAAPATCVVSCISNPCPSYHKKGNILNRSCLVHFGLSSLLRSVFGPFNLLRSLRFNLVLFDPFWSNLVYFGLFGPFGPHLSNSVYSVQSIHFGPFGLIRSILAHFSLFGPIRCTNLRMAKDKFWLRILSII